jgi:predicted site-specific integrase-resolvase
MVRKRQTKVERGTTHAEDPILTINEVGRQIGKSHQTVGSWCKAGLINAWRLPSGCWAVRQSEVNKFLAGSALDKQVGEVS